MIAFHRLLIGTAIFFFVMLAALEFNLIRLGRGGSMAWALGIGSAVAAAGLGWYLANLRRFIGR